MAGPGLNLAVTKDGGSYNKLQRPQDYLMPSTHPPPPKAMSPANALSSTSASKRKRDHANGTSKHKRTRLEQDNEEVGNPRTWTSGREKPRSTDCGMRSLLPGLDDEEHTSDDGVSEALAYLRDVRSEASAIPHLLVASTARDHGHTDTSEQVLFEDGTWIALDEHRADHSSDRSSENEAIDPDPQDRLYELLLKRYQGLRATLAAMIEEGDEATRRTSQATIDLAYSLSDGRAWSKTVDKDFPTLELIQQLDDSTVYSGLTCCAENIDRAASISPQLSCWMWTLLASVGDVGTLDNWKMSRIRALGQKIGLLSMRLRSGSSQCQPSSEAINIEDNKSTHVNTGCNTKDDVCEGTMARDPGDVQDRNDIHQNDGADGAEASVKQSEALDNESFSQAKPTTESVEPEADIYLSVDEISGQQGAEDSNIEQARARLLKQLGDRLVQAQLPSPETSPKLDALRDGMDYQGSDGVCSEKREGPAGYEADLNTRVAIDTVLTIVAEYFGQKDLLEYRQRW